MTPLFSLHCFGEHPTVLVNCLWKLERSLNPDISPIMLIDRFLSSIRSLLASSMRSSVLHVRKSFPISEAKYWLRSSFVVPISEAISSLPLSYSLYFFFFFYFESPFLIFSSELLDSASTSASGFLRFLFLLGDLPEDRIVQCPKASSSSLWLPMKEMKFPAK